MKFNDKSRSFYLCFIFLFVSCVKQQNGKKNLTILSVLNQLSNDSQQSSTSAKSQLVFPPEDPFYQDQWYLKNTGQNDGTKGIDINIEPVWKQGYAGKGVYVGVLDTWIDPKHPDLKDNLSSENIVNYYKGKEQCTSAGSGHGTASAGIIAARDNKIGIRGIAPRAILYNYAIEIDPNTQYKTFFPQALNKIEYKKIAVYNGSFGDRDDFYNHPSKEQQEAMDLVTKEGFENKGSSLVFSAGNRSTFRGDGRATNNSQTNHYASIAVNSINSKGQVLYIVAGTESSNLWLAAPGAKLKTTDAPGSCGYKEGDYFDDYGATSGAAPMVSGVIALLRGAYPELTWRDIKLILAESARKLDVSSSANYQITGVFYSDSKKIQKYSQRMGFGLVNADTAFQLAKTWKQLPAMKTETFDTTSSLDTSTGDTILDSSFTIRGSKIGFIESVTVEIDIEKSKSELHLKNVGLSLISPDNKKAEFYLFAETNAAKLKSENKQFLLLANNFLGSSVVNGTWKLQIQQKHTERITQIKNWKLIIRGH